jgi:hypothetical protein
MAWGCYVAWRINPPLCSRSGRLLADIVTMRALMGKPVPRASPPTDHRADPGGENLSWCSPTSTARLLEIHPETVDKPPDPPQAREFLPARRKRR